MESDPITSAFTERLLRLARQAETLRREAAEREHGQVQIDRISVHSPLVAPEGLSPPRPKA